jgi:hypothetical protein
VEGLGGLGGTAGAATAAAAEAAIRWCAAALPALEEAVLEGGAGEGGAAAAALAAATVHRGWARLLRGMVGTS